jgi:hypothetical protein
MPAMRLTNLRRTDAQATERGIDSLTNARFNEAINLLVQNGFDTVEDLWVEIGNDFFPGLAELARKCNLSPDQLIQVLGDGARPRQAASKERPDIFRFWLSEHWAEIFAALIAAVLLVILVVGAFIPRPTILVNANAGLPAFHVISESDVVVGRTVRRTDSFSDKSDVVGRYTLKNISPGTVLVGSQLSKSRLSRTEVESRTVLSVPLRSGSLLLPLEPGTHVRLLLSPRKSAQGDGRCEVNVLCGCKRCDSTKNCAQILEPSKAGLDEVSVDDAIVLDIKREVEMLSIVVAIRDSDLAKLTLLLAASEVTVSVPLR